MKKTSIIAVLTALVAFSGCKKDDDKNSGGTKDCDTKNYGVLLVNFGSTVEKHDILITIPNSGGKVRDKIVPAGKASDTVQLAPNTYPVNISSLNDQNQAIDQKTVSATVTKCNDTHVTVDF